MTDLPEVVSHEEWCGAHEALLSKEKAAARARDALAAERRRLPMVEIEPDYVFDTPDGPRRLLNLFDGRMGWRGVEALGPVWTLLDLTPLGRQDAREDTPDERPHREAYTWWRRHDEYEPAEVTR